MSDPDGLIEGVDETADAEIEQTQAEIAQLISCVHEQLTLADECRDWIDAVLGELADVRDHLSLVDLAGMLLQIREVRKRYAESEALIESWTARAMRDGKASVPGFELIRRGGSKWRFDKDRSVFGSIVDKALQESSGEVTIETLWLLVDYIEQACKPSWRTGPAALPALGINPADHAERVPNRRTVEVRAVQVDTE